VLEHLSRSSINATHIKMLVAGKSDKNGGACILARNFVRGSVVEVAGGKRQRKIDGARRGVMTQL
jgi:hypothetical protein